ncbi:pituitary tumor-transforming gene 1 protein-interacting protein-like isoform X2 [Ruditapes philippinarum]|uniref:pituitary tumor-transforming gene 1 protein-interacting protein-like isoform X2 n=1 Tax=Ruditapes philippinarum TaxID=129788 RepID=UPI00295BE57B|nr:pituitary tumor-transforming gene 1 protein-interacting protein-like isoform X2 [Ruditapes philippinarum]
MKCFILFVFFGAVINGVLSASTSKAPVVTTDNPSTTQKTTQKPTGSTSNVVTTPKLTPAEECQKANSSCDTCVKVGSVQCVWCASSSKCMLKEHVIPTSECGLADAKWAVCWVNYEALIIACSVIGGVLILGLTICICCCCCCKGNKNAKYAKEDAKYERKKTEMKAGQAERRAERKAKTDEIRKKYGIDNV